MRIIENKKFKKYLLLICGCFLVLGLLFYADIGVEIKQGMSILFWGLMVTLILSLGIVYFYENERISFETLYLLAASILCVVYIIVLPPSTINDEHYHITMSYHYSNVLLGKANLDTDRSIEWSTTYIREDDVPIIVDELLYWGSGSGVAERPTSDMYTRIKDNIFHSKVENESLVPGIPGYSKVTNIIEYMPSTIAFTIARILHLNAYLMLYMAKFFDAISFVLLCYCAIKVIPKQYKAVLSLITLVPVVLQEGTAISYDSVTLALCFLLTAFLFKIISCDIIRKKDIFWTIVISDLLAFCKSGVYVVFLGVIFYEIFSNKIDKKTKVVSTLFLLISVGTIIIYQIKITPNITRLSNEKYSLSFMGEQPIEYIKMLIRTVVCNMSYFFESSIGRHIGWNQAIVPAWVSYLFLFILVYSTLFWKRDKKYLDKVYVYSCIFVIMLIMFLICSAMLTDTNIGSNVIQGIQGRYLVPLIPLAMFIFVRSEIDRDQISKIYLSYIIVHIVEMYYLLRVFLTR